MVPEHPFPPRNRWALSLATNSREMALSAAMLLRHTLVLGEANTGKTAVLHQILEEANRDAGLPRALLVDAKLAGDVRQLIDLILDTAVLVGWVPSGQVPAHDDLFGPIAQIDRLLDVSHPSLVLIDDATREQAVLLFGRFRDALFQLPHVTFTVTTSRAVGDALAKPPMNAFFDTVVVLDPPASAQQDNADADIP